MAENVTRVTLPQLVDLSLNCPELGTLNFNVLHTLLNVLIHQLNQDGVSVEFRGADSDRIQGLLKATKPANGTITLSDFNVVGGQKNGKKRKSVDVKKISLGDVKKLSKLEELKEKELRQIHPRRDSKQEPIMDPEPLKSPPGSAHSMVVVVHPEGHKPQKSVAISKTTFIAMVDDIQHMKDKMRELMDIPGNMGLIEAARSQEPSPILEMFNVIQLNKRMEASEKTVEKLISLVEDLARNKEAGGWGALEDQGSHRELYTGGGGAGVPRDLEKRILLLEEGFSVLAEGAGIDMKALGAHLSRVSSREDEGAKSPYGGGSSDEEMEVGKKTKKKHKSQLDSIQLSDMPPNQALSIIQEELLALNDILDTHDFVGILKDLDMLKSRIEGEDGVSKANVLQMQSKATDYARQMDAITNTYNNQISSLQGQVAELQREMVDAIKKLDALLPGGDASGLEGQGILDLYNKLIQVQGEVNVIAETGNSLMEEKLKREQGMEVMLEQIELLRIVKANREELDEVLGEKADACAVNRKVSRDQFDAACDDLSKGIEEALKKLTQQEEMWQQALEDIQREIGNKLDKMEVDPLRDFVNSKLTMLQDKLKTLTSLKQAREAAGSKNRILRDVNCISCDKDVIMKREMDVSLKPNAPPLPPARNIAPYLAYELDQLRKQQKCIPGGKNLNYFETAMKTAKAVKARDHLCNRYCGGSHTTTTPQQRVSRMGHFLDQWGKEMAPGDGDEYAKGEDGRMYKARDESTVKRPTKSGSFVPTKKHGLQVESRSLFREATDGVQRTHSAGHAIASEEAKEVFMKESSSGTAASKTRPRSSTETVPRSLSFTQKRTSSHASGTMTERQPLVTTTTVSREVLTHEVTEYKPVDGHEVKFARIEEEPEREAEEMQGSVAEGNEVGA